MTNNIRYEIKKLSQSNTEPYGRKRALFLSLIYQATTAFSKEGLKNAFDAWINYCQSQQQMPTVYYDSWIWDDWEKYSRLTLELGSQQLAFINAVKETELNKFHDSGTAVTKNKLLQSIARLQREYNQLDH